MTHWLKAQPNEVFQLEIPTAKYNFPHNIRKLGLFSLDVIVKGLPHKYRQVLRWSATTRKKQKKAWAFMKVSFKTIQKNKTQNLHKSLKQTKKLVFSSHSLGKLLMS